MKNTHFMLAKFVCIILILICPNLCFSQGINQTSKFFSWDTPSARLGIGTISPSYSLDVRGAEAANGHISNGTKFTTSGCSVSATSGGATSGTYISGTTGSCAVVITMNGATGLIAPNGWSCYANDETTPADKQQTTSHSSTTATVGGTTVSGDVVSFGCIGY